MISCIYSLKDVCDQLFGVILKLTEKTKSVINETPAKLEEVLVKSFKTFSENITIQLEDMLNQQQSSINNNTAEVNNKNTPLLNTEKTCCNPGEKRWGGRWFKAI